MRHANMICTALDGFQNVQILKNDLFFACFIQKCGPRTPILGFVRPSRLHFFKMRSMKGIQVKEKLDIILTFVLFAYI